MIRTTTFAAATLAALFTAAPPLAAQAPVRAEPVECSDRGSRDRQQYCEVREYVLSARSSLDVDAGHNGGIEVMGWDREDIRVVARVSAWGNDAGEARTVAEGVDITVGDRVAADGPRFRGRDDRSWAVSYEIHVPQGMRLRLDAMNGGIRLEDVAGDVDAHTMNGGIEVLGAAGRIRGETTNGGLHVELTGRRWDGAGLDLRSTNGGVTIRVPDGYSAELETGTVNGGIDLDFPVTVQGRLRRSLRTTLGEGGPLIRAMTTNGGVSLERT